MSRLDEIFDKHRRHPALSTQHSAPTTPLITPVTHHSSLITHHYSLATRHLINIGSGKDLAISELAEMVARTVGYDGPVAWDPTKPDGTPQKLLDVSRMTTLGWQPRISLEEGIRLAYRDYLQKGEA